MKSKNWSISFKIRLFVIIVVLSVSLIIAVTSFITNTVQVDNFCKRMSYNSAENFASMTDPEFLAKLREATESSDYQRLREEASKKKDESMIQDYLTEKGLWDQFCQVRKEMCSYLENMDDIKYLYVIVLGNKASYRDMYLIDDFDKQGLKVQDLYHTLAMTLALNNAMTEGRTLNKQEMTSIVDDLFACHTPNYTPDGKLIITIIPEEKIVENFVKS